VNIYISYRRSDTAEVAGRLSDRFAGAGFKPLPVRKN